MIKTVFKSCLSTFKNMNMMKESNFQKIFSDSSQMMLKLGRNIQLVDIL